MTRLPGRAEFAPLSIELWLRQMAEALPAIHDVPLATPQRRYRPYYDQRTRNAPAWSKQPKAWRHALDLARSRQPRTTSRFIHRDYHPWNILWQRGKLSGVVDWISACAGPPQVDVAHCRVNLVWFHGLDVADRFLAAYADASGSSVEDYDPYWDAMALADTGLVIADIPWFDAGLTLPLVRRRLDALAVAIAGLS